MRVLKEKIARKKNLEIITGKELYEIIKEDKEETREIIEEFIQNLYIGFLNFIKIFEPEAICIGGSFVHFEDVLLDKLIDKMSKEEITANISIPKIIIAKMRK